MAATETTPSSSIGSRAAGLGVVLGPDGKPCKPCTAFRNWTKDGQKREISKTTLKTTTGSAISTVASGAAAFGVAETESDRAARCPADVEQLGRSTWTFLHTTAAYYPEKPTPTQKTSMLSLLRALPVLYPCSHCADHLRTNVRENPPENAILGRELLSKWLCDRHNDVNRRIGKEVFDCTKTDERWRDGPADGSCD